jgi:anti-sigma factor RsiW
VPAAAFLLVLGLATALYVAVPPRRPSAPPALVVEVVNDYIRFTQRGLPDQANTDPRQVIERFQGRLDFGLDVAIQGQRGFQLVGGDLSYFLDRKVACLLYRKGPHIVTLSVLRREGIEVPKGAVLSERGHPLYLAQHRGLTVIVWERNDLLHALVSDMDARDLAPFATSLAPA